MIVSNTVSPSPKGEGSWLGSPLNPRSATAKYIDAMTQDMHMGNNV